MNVTVSSEHDIPVYKMRDGDMAVITRWGTHNQYAGRVVQRFDKALVAIGLPSGNGWATIFGDVPPQEHLRVRLLAPDTTLKLSP